MKKAVIFDLFETLITEWGHDKYTKRQMSQDLHCPFEEFAACWETLHEKQYCGEISFADSIRYVCNKLGIPVYEKTIEHVISRRKQTKAACFDYVYPEIYSLLKILREKGYKLGILSNCSQEEVTLIKESEIYQYFDEVILSYEVHMKKPDSCIYEEAARRLGVALSECIFVGDGGSNELVGAKAVGMKAIQAKWYTNQHPHKRANIDGFFTAEEPLDIVEYINRKMSKS